jgi:predicted ABC-type ATPase
VVKFLTAGSGLRAVSFDEMYEYLVKNADMSHQERMQKSSDLSKRRLQTYIEGRLGLIIDRTSWNYNSIHGLKEGLERIGYDTFMVYVNTDLNVAKERVAARLQKTGRNVDSDFIDKVSAELSKNIGKYQQEFKDNFVIIDNTQVKTDPATFKSSLQFAQKKLDKFLNEKPRSPAASEWINKQS